MLLRLWAGERVRCVKAGPVSGQPHSPVGPHPPPSPPPSIYLWGPYMHAWCVSECEFEGGSCARSWSSPALAGRRPGTDSQKFHGDISEAVREQSVWLITPIQQHSIVIRITLLNSAGVIPGNRPVESWITPVLIVLPGSLAGVALRRALSEENRKPGLLFSFPRWNSERLHMFGRAPETCVENSKLNGRSNGAKLPFKSRKCTAGGRESWLRRVSGFRVHF